MKRPVKMLYQSASHWFKPNDSESSYLDLEIEVLEVGAHKQQRDILKIAIVTETWPPEINGVSLSMVHLLKGLQHLGHKILLIRPEQKTRSKVFRPEQECLVKAQSIPMYKQLQFGWPQLFKVAHALDNFQPDVLHIVTEGPLGLVALNQAKRRKIPVSSGFHSSFHDFSRHFDLVFLVQPIQRYLKWFHNNTQLTCVPSSDTETALRQFGLTCPMQVIGRGVDTVRFHPQKRCQQLRQQWGADDDTTVLLSVGRISPEKSLPEIFSAYAQLQQHQASRKFVLVVVGDGPQLSNYQKNYPDIIFMGQQIDETLSRCYASADVFLFASQAETFGNVVLEAMASGLPVLAYNYACAAQMVLHQHNGWLAPVADKLLWQRYLINLPSITVVRQMGQHALQQVGDSGWEKPIMDFHQALKQVVRQHTDYVVAK